MTYGGWLMVYGTHDMSDAIGDKPSAVRYMEG
jgi:hypothetical protein